MLLKTVDQRGLDGRDLGAQAGDHADEGGNGGGVGVGHQRRCRQLRSAQRSTDLGRAALEVALSPAAPQSSAEARGDASIGGDGEGGRDHGDSVLARQVRAFADVDRDVRPPALPQ